MTTTITDDGQMILTVERKLLRDHGNAFVKAGDYIVEMGTWHPRFISLTWIDGYWRKGPRSRVTVPDCCVTAFYYPQKTVKEVVA